MNKEVFVNNRRKILEKLQDNTVLVLFSGEAPKKSADEAYSYTPNRNFYYMAGIDEKNIIMVLGKVRGSVEEKLFINRIDPVMERWVGKTIRPEEAKESSGISNIAFTDEFYGFMHALLNSEKVDTVYLDLERDQWESEETKAEKLVSDLKRKYPYIAVKNAYNIIAELRMIKSPEEIEQIREAISITWEGIQNAMRNVKPGTYEYVAEAYFDFALKVRGVKDFAFKTIAASGKNAAVLHYSSNDSIIGQADMLLMDLGAQWNYYNADITRTFPASGKFTERQKQIYDIVLKAQLEVINTIKPGVPFKDLNAVTRKLYVEELSKLGLVSNDEELSKYYFHGVSHHLGLDTHDVGSRDMELKPGMVLTVEPGLYIEDEGIGIRIEDDVLVTEDGCQVLSDYIIKTTDEIEQFMNQK